LKKNLKVETPGSPATSGYSPGNTTYHIPEDTDECSILHLIKEQPEDGHTIGTKHVDGIVI